jgi:hypothetical protein
MLPADIRSRTTNPLNLPVDACMFSNFIRRPPTYGRTLTNYASMPLNRPRTLPNRMSMLSNCMRMLSNCKRMFANYIAQNLNKIAQIPAIGGRNPQFPAILPKLSLTWQITLLKSARFWLDPENAPSHKCGALTLLDPHKIDQRNLLAVARPRGRAQSTHFS